MERETAGEESLDDEAMDDEVPSSGSFTVRPDTEEI